MPRASARLIRVAVLTACASLAAAPAGAEPLKGRYDAVVDAAMACAAATGPTGVDRKALAAAGWGDTVSAEIDHLPASWARNPKSPFEVRINQYDLMQPEECSLSANFKKQRDYEEVRKRLEQRLRRAPDSVEPDDMRTVTWLGAKNAVELWMMPAHKLCYECPTMFATIRPTSKGNGAKP